MKLEKLLTLTVLICCFIALFTMSSCASRPYYFTCYGANGDLIHHEERNWLVNTTVMDNDSYNCYTWRTNAQKN